MPNLVDRVVLPTFRLPKRSLFAPLGNVVLGRRRRSGWNQGRCPRVGRGRRAVWRGRGGEAAVRCYGLRALALAVVLSALVVRVSFALGGTAGLAVGCVIVLGCAWIVYFYSERAVLSALRARPVSEVEMPELYGMV